MGFRGCLQERPEPGHSARRKGAEEAQAMVIPGPRLSPGTPVCLRGHGGSSRGAPGVAAGTMAAVPCALNGHSSPHPCCPSLQPVPSQQPIACIQSLTTVHVPLVSPNFTAPLLFLLSLLFLSSLPHLSMCVTDETPLDWWCLCCLGTCMAHTTGLPCWF